MQQIFITVYFAIVNFIL